RVVGSPGSTELLGDDQVVRRLLTELDELDVPGIGTRNDLDCNEVVSRARDLHELLRLLHGDVVVGARGDDVAGAVENVKIELGRGARRTHWLLAGPGLIELEVDVGV